MSSEPYQYVVNSKKREFGEETQGKGALEHAGLSTDASNVIDATWAAILPADVYKVTRAGQTQAKGTGFYTKHKDNGTYKCICCATKLFESDAKFDSGCGWPSFHAAIGDDVRKKDGQVSDEDATSTIKRLPDDSRGRQRVEVKCKKCDAHLGHVFNDAPQKPTGERYCINSLCLTFEPNLQALEPAEEQ